MDARTTTPWKVFKASNGYIVGIGDKDGGGIVDAGFGLWRDGPEREANAAFIVKAVNAHDELVDALQEAREYFDGRADITDRTDDLGRPFPNEEMVMLALIDEALAKAGTEETQT